MNRTEKLEQRIENLEQEFYLLRRQQAEFERNAKAETQMITTTVTDFLSATARYRGYKTAPVNFVVRKILDHLGLEIEHVPEGFSLSPKKIS